MKYIINILMIFILFSTLISCEKKAILSNDKKELSDSLIRPLGNLGFGADSLAWVKCCYEKLAKQLKDGTFALKDRTFVINSNTEYNAFKNYASCLEIISWPPIDFARYTMLAGIRMEGAMMARIIPEKFSLTNHNGNYKFIVTIHHGAYWAVMAVYYWILTDKISPDSDVEFIIEYENPINI